MNRGQHAHYSAGLAACLQAALARGEWREAERLAVLLASAEHRAGHYLARDQAGTLAAVCRQRAEAAEAMDRM